MRRSSKLGSFRHLMALIVVAGLAPLLAAQNPVAAPASAPVSIPATATIPFELAASNHMVVLARINGKGPFRLIFDSGAPISLLGNKAAEESGAVAKNAPKSFLMGMRGEGKIETLEVGELKGKDVPVIILDHPTVKALASMLGKPLDGIIGYTFFSRYRTTIDYQAKLMTFTPVNFEGRNLIESLSGRLTGPKVAKRRVLAPSGLWGLTLGDPLEDGSGIAIKTVRPGSPAEVAGLKGGDVLTTLDGRWTTTVADVYTAANGVALGQPAEAVVIREGQEKKISVKPIGGI